MTGEEVVHLDPEPAPVLARTLGRPGTWAPPHLCSWKQTQRGPCSLQLWAPWFLMPLLFILLLLSLGFLSLSQWHLLLFI